LLQLRLKIVKLLTAYLNNTLETSQNKSAGESTGQNPDFSSCLRLLSKEENISILHDGLTFLVRFVLNNYHTVNALEASLNASLKVKDFEETLIKLVNKLVLSKYESHVENGLDFLLQLFTYFSGYYQGRELPCKALYIKIG
jgi:hypothetical protein